jgi:hypothetical protein
VQLQARGGLNFGSSENPSSKYVKTAIILPKKIIFRFAESKSIDKIPEILKDCLDILSNLIHTGCLEVIVINFGRVFHLVDKTNDIGLQTVDIITQRFKSIQELEFTFFHAGQLKLISNLRYHKLTRVKFSSIWYSSPTEVTLLIGTLCRKKLMTSISMSQIQYVETSTLSIPPFMPLDFHFNGLSELCIFGVNEVFLLGLPMIAGAPSSLILGHPNLDISTRNIKPIEEHFGCQVIVSQRIIVVPKDQKK